MSAPWENPPLSWEAAATDDHGGTAVWAECDDCQQWSWCLYLYDEASGPCELDPDYEERLRAALADPHSGVIPGGAALRGQAAPLCGNCVPVIQLCVDRAACHARGRPWPPSDCTLPPRTVPRPEWPLDSEHGEPGAPPWAREGGEDR